MKVMEFDTKPYEQMAKIVLSDEERNEIAAWAAMLADDFAALDQINTDAEPLVTVLPLTNVWREDISEKIFTRETLLANAPEQYDGYFAAPKTLLEG